MNTILKQFLPAIIAPFVGIALWAFIVRVFSIPSYLLPSPQSVLASISNSYPTLLYDAGITFSEALTGFALCIVGGTLLSISFQLWPITRRTLYPYLVATRIAPIIAVAPFLLLWLGNGFLAKAATAAVVSTFFTVINLMKGFDEVSGGARELMRSLSATRFQVLLKLQIPNAVPYFFAGIKAALATSIAGAVAAEFVSSNAGLGHLILTNYYYFRTAEMFGALLVLIAGGVLIFGAISLTERVFFSHYSVRREP